MNLEGFRRAEDLALRAINSLPDSYELYLSVENKAEDHHTEEEIEHAMDLVDKFMFQKCLPRDLIETSWLCPICSDVETLYGTKCESCLRIISKPRADIDDPNLKAGIGISEIANMD